MIGRTEGRFKEIFYPLASLFGQEIENVMKSHKGRIVENLRDSEEADIIIAIDALYEKEKGKRIFVRDIAESAEMSPETVGRTCRRFGFKGGNNRGRYILYDAKLLRDLVDSYGLDK